MHTDPSFKSTWDPYLESLPGPDEVLSADSMSEGHLAMLQSADLVRAVPTVCALCAALLERCTGQRAAACLLPQRPLPWGLDRGAVPRSAMPC